MTYELPEICDSYEHVSVFCPAQQYSRDIGVVDPPGTTIPLELHDQTLLNVCRFAAEVLDAVWDDPHAVRPPNAAPTEAHLSIFFGGIAQGVRLRLDSPRSFRRTSGGVKIRVGDADITIKCPHVPYELGRIDELAWVVEPSPRRTGTRAGHVYTDEPFAHGRRSSLTERKPECICDRMRCI